MKANSALAGIAASQTAVSKPESSEADVHKSSHWSFGSFRCRQPDAAGSSAFVDFGSIHSLQDTTPGGSGSARVFALPEKELRARRAHRRIR